MKLLRPANRADFEELNRIARQVGDLHAQWGVCESVEYVYPMDFFLDVIEGRDEMYKLYVADDNGAIVGFVRFYTWNTNGAGALPRKFLSIEDIGVDEAIRNRGIGQQIMDDLREFAHSEGCTDFQLYVDAHNETALAFYKKCGFHICNYGMQMKL